MIPAVKVLEEIYFSHQIKKPVWFTKLRERLGTDRKSLGRAIDWLEDSHFIEGEWEIDNGKAVCYYKPTWLIIGYLNFFGGEETQNG